MLARLKRCLPDAADDLLLAELLREAEQYLRAYTRRESLPAELNEACLRLAAIRYNRLGMEGETGHTEGGIARTAESLPEDLRKELAPWRRAVTAR